MMGTIERPHESDDLLDLTGEQIDKWELVRPLGKGGMAVVYEAHHIWLNQRAAVKLLHPSSYGDPDALERFQREALVVSHLAHPHIVEIRDFGEDVEHSYFMVMELLDGQDLGQFLKETPFSLELASALLGQICDALEAIHDAEVVHRDLKPSNIFLLPNDPYPFVKVLDFGIAKAHFAENGDLTATHSIVGTPHYLAPEQIRSKQKITPQTDIYALGVMMFQLLAGRLPFDGDGTFEHMLSIVQETPPPIGDFRPGLRGTKIEGLISQMLHKKPKERPASARVLWEEWEAALAEVDASERTGAFTHLNPQKGPTSVKETPSTKSAQTCSLQVTRGLSGPQPTPSTPLPGRPEATKEAFYFPQTHEAQGTRKLPLPSKGLATGSFSHPPKAHSALRIWQAVGLGVCLLGVLGWVLFQARSAPSGRAYVLGSHNARPDATPLSQKQDCLERQPKQRKSKLIALQQALQTRQWQRGYQLFQALQEQSKEPLQLQCPLMMVLGPSLPGFAAAIAQETMRRLLPSDERAFLRKRLGVLKQTSQQQQKRWKRWLKEHGAALAQRGTARSFQAQWDLHLSRRYGLREWNRWLKENMHRLPMEGVIRLWKVHIALLKQLRQDGRLSWLRLQRGRLPDTARVSVQEEGLALLRSVYRAHKAIRKRWQSASLQYKEAALHKANSLRKQYRSQGVFWSLHTHPKMQLWRTWPKLLPKAWKAYRKSLALTHTASWKQAAVWRATLRRILKEATLLQGAWARRLKRQASREQSSIALYQRADRAYKMKAWNKARLLYTEYLQHVPGDPRRKELKRRRKACRCAITLFPWEVCRRNDYPQHHPKRR